MKITLKNQETPKIKIKKMFLNKGTIRAKYSIDQRKTQTVFSTPRIKIRKVTVWSKIQMNFYKMWLNYIQKKSKN